MNGDWRWWTMFGIGLLALILQAIQTFPTLIQGSYFSLGAVVFYVLIGLVVVSVLFLISAITRNRNNRTATPNARGNTQLHHGSNEVFLLSSEIAKEREVLAEKLRLAPKLWIEYKPKDLLYGTESFVFSKDGDQTIVEIEPGPLIWDLLVEHPITFLNNVSPVRTQPVECKIAVSEANVSHGGIPDHLREIMRKYETTVSPTMTLRYQITDGTWFQQTYSLSIDPYNKLVIKPEGPVRLHN